MSLEVHQKIRLRHKLLFLLIEGIKVTAGQWTWPTKFCLMFVQKFLLEEWSRCFFSLTTAKELALDTNE